MNLDPLVVGSRIGRTVLLEATALASQVSRSPISLSRLTRQEVISSGRVGMMAADDEFKPIPSCRTEPDARVLLSGAGPNILIPDRADYRYGVRSDRAWVLRNGLAGR